MVLNDELLAPYHGSKPYIFLSYSHRNADRAEDIIRHLNQAGFRVWYDQGLTPGREWDENIAHIIMGCSYFMALITEEYLDSSNCKDELNYARDKAKPLLLIYLEDVTLPAGMELRLGRIFAIHEDQFDDEEFFYDRICDAEGIDCCCEYPLRRTRRARAGRESGYVTEEYDDRVPAGRRPRQSHVLRNLLLFLILVLFTVAGFAAAKHYSSQIKSLMKRAIRYTVSEMSTPAPAQATVRVDPTIAPDETNDPNAIVVITDDTPVTPAPEEIFIPIEDDIPEETPTPQETLPPDTLEIQEPDEGTGQTGTDMSDPVPLPDTDEADEALQQMIQDATLPIG